MGRKQEGVREREVWWSGGGIEKRGRKWIREKEGCSSDRITKITVHRSGVELEHLFY